jgi:hypothetical protein
MEEPWMDNREIEPGLGDSASLRCLEASPGYKGPEKEDNSLR